MTALVMQFPGAGPARAMARIEPDRFVAAWGLAGPLADAALILLGIHRTFPAGYELFRAQCALRDALGRIKSGDVLARLETFPDPVPALAGAGVPVELAAVLSRIVLGGQAAAAGARDEAVFHVAGAIGEIVALIEREWTP